MIKLHILTKQLNRKYSIFLLMSLVFFMFFLEKTKAQNVYELKTLVIDAGHGGKDPGAVGKISYEKNIVLKIALKLGKTIKRNFPEIRVIYTRNTDKFIELHERAQIANRNNADLFISIHVNASSNKKAYGTSSYVMGLSSADKNMAVAKRENSVISIETGSKKYKGFNTETPENNIILQLRQNTNINQSIYLASKIQKQFRYYAKRKDRGVYQAGLIVLYNTAMPGVLVETGFISNATEERWLNTAQGQSTIAMAIYRAFRDYKTELESKSTGKFVLTPDRVNSRKENKSEIQEKKKEREKTKSIVKKKEINTTPVNKIVYRVQFKTSHTKLNLNSSEFRGLEKVDMYYQGGRYKYVCGEEVDYNSALKLLNEVKKKYKDAFIVRFKNGKRI